MYNFRFLINGFCFIAVLILSSCAQFQPLPADQTSPVITLLSPTPDHTYKGKILVAGSLEDNSDVTLEYQLDNGDRVLTPVDTKFAFLVGASAGTHTLTLFATDTGGNQTQVSTRFSVEDFDATPLAEGDNEAPVIHAFVYDLGVGTAPTDIVAAWYVTDDSEDPLSCTLDYGDGTVLPIPNCSFGITEGHTVTDPGEYTMTLTVTDGEGASAVASADYTVYGDLIALIHACSSLLSIDTAEAELLDLLVPALIGGVDFTGVLWEELAGEIIDIDTLALSIQQEFSLATPVAALEEDLTLSLLLSLTADDAIKQEVTDVLDLLAARTAALEDTLSLDDLLKADVLKGNILSANVDALDFVIAFLKLYSYVYVETPPAFIDLDAAALDALGLSSTINAARLKLQITEAPILKLAKRGTTFHTAAVRLMLEVEPIDASITSLPGLEALLAPLLGAANLNTNLNIDEFTLYVEINRLDGVVTAINPFTEVVRVKATPGIADIYLGYIPEAVFFNREYAVSSLDVQPASIGSLDLQATLLGGVTVGAASLDVLAKADARAEAPFRKRLTYRGPYAETQQVATSSAALVVFLEDLLDELNITVNVQASSGILGPIISFNENIATLITPTVQQLIDALPLYELMTGFVDPLLDFIGVTLEEADITILDLLEAGAWQE